jgi:hypothetical protein
MMEIWNYRIEEVSHEGMSFPKPYRMQKGSVDDKLLKCL